MKYPEVILILGLLFFSCNTNPPTDPNKLSLKSGEVVIRITYTEDQSVNPDKTVLLEDFANVSCTPCVISNQIIKRFSQQVYGHQQLVVVKFPTNFPSPNDPFYNANKDANDFRIGYYSIFFAPTTIVDGIVRPTSTDSTSIMQAIDGRLNQQADFKISITREVRDNAVLFDVDIIAKNTGSYNLDELFLRFALIESEIEFDTAPGSNGETKFYDVMREVFPSNEGFVMSDVENYTTRTNFNFENTIDTTWNLNRLHAVAFIQNGNSKEVFVIRFSSMRVC